MQHDGVSPQNITDLIEHLINTKDPATVGLRRILKKKSECGKDFPLQQHTYEDFSMKASPARVFDETEKRVMTLEKENIIFKQKLEQQKAASERAVKEAYAKGIQEGGRKGECAGREKADAAYQEQLKILEERIALLIQNIERSRTNLFAEAHRVVLDVSILMARKILNTELSINRDIVLSVIKKALTYLADRQTFIVRVSPDDLETVSQKKDFWSSISDRMTKITLEPDARIEQGGCIIESSSGITDARIPVQIDELIDIIDATWDNLLTSGNFGCPETTPVADSLDSHGGEGDSANEEPLLPDNADT